MADNDCPCCAPPWVMSKMLRQWNMVKVDDNGSNVQWIYGFSDLPLLGSNHSVGDLVYDPISGDLYVSNNNITSGNAVLRRIKKADASLVWASSLGAPGGGNLLTGGLAVSRTTGRVICCPSGVGGNFIREVDPASGATIWEDVAVGGPKTSVNFSSGGVIATSSSFGVSHNGVTMERDIVSGGAVWATGHGLTSGNAIYCATDQSLICSVGNRGTGSFVDTTRVFDAAGVLQWSADHGGTVSCCAFLSNGNIVTVGAVSSSITTRCYDSAGVPQWTANHGAQVNHVCVDANDNIYTAGDFVSGVGNVRKYDSSGTLLWSFDYTLGKGVFGATAIAVDDAGYVYIGGSQVTF